MATGESKTKWAGNLANNSVEAENTVSLNYRGKLSLQEILNSKPGDYVCPYENNSNFNRLYYDNNLPALASLLRDNSVCGRVRLIYIDPPYATGGIFKSRSRQDAYTDLLNGAQYIEFLRQRLIFLRELLANDGSIYVHLDMNMAFHIKIIMDEIFGEKNFRNWITRKKCNPKNYTRKSYGNISDFILFYSKSDNYVWNRPYDAWTEESAEREYQYIEAESGRRYKKVPIHAPGTRNGATGKAWRDMLPPQGKHWQYTPEKLDEMDKNGEIYWSANGNPRRKIYLDQSLGKSAQDIWLEYKDAHNQNIKITGYPTEKNPDLLHRIVQASSNPDDIILDCFAGSGTTLEAATKLGRQWVGIDNSQQAIRAIVKRFAVGRQAMGDFVNGAFDNKEPPNSKQMNLFDFDQQSPPPASTPNASGIDPFVNKPLEFSIFTPPEKKSEIERAVRQWVSDPA